MLNLKNIINNLPCAVMVANYDRRIILVNRMTPIIFGEDENNLIGKRGGDIMGCVHATESPSGCGYSEACKLCGAKCAVNRAFREKMDIEPFETLIETQLQGQLYWKVTVTYLKNPSTMLNNEVTSAVIVTIDDMTEYIKRERFEADLETVGAICH